MTVVTRSQMKTEIQAKKEETPKKVPQRAERCSDENHPTGWTPITHYGQCGQSCPCCRRRVGDTLGACTICK